MVFAIVIIVMSTFETRAYANGLLDGGSGNSVNGIKDGWGQFINDLYRHNYQLDAGDVGAWEIIDKGINSFSNFIFFLMLLVSWLGINVFSFCFGSNISGKFAEMLEGVSVALKTGVFDKFFMIMFMISLLSLLIYFLKRNYAAVLNHIVIVALLSILSIVFSSSGARTFVMETTNLSNDIGMTLISSLSGESNSEATAKNMIGTLWGNLVHKPWVILEYDGKVSVEDYNQNAAIKKSKEMLSLSKNSDERKELAKKEIKDVSFTNRLASTFILFIINTVKIGILMLLGVIQIFLQILSNIMILIAPVLLLLAIVPFFGGLNMLKWLGQKYLGIQLNIIFLSFAIGVLVVIDKVVLSFFMGMGASFTIGLLIQCICWVLLIVFRKQVVMNFSKAQRRLNGSIGAAKLMSRVLDKEAYLGKKVADKAGDIGVKATRPAINKAVDMKDFTVRKIRYAAKYSTGNAKLATAKAAGVVIDRAASKFSDIKNSMNSNVKSTEVDNEAREQAKENINTNKVDLKDKLKEKRDLQDNVVDFNSKIRTEGPTNASEGDKKESNITSNKKEIKEKLQQKKVESVEGTSLKEDKEINRDNNKSEINDKLRAKREEGVETQSNTPNRDRAESSAVNNNSEEKSNNSNIGSNKEEINERLRTERKDMEEGKTIDIDIDRESGVSSIIDNKSEEKVNEDNTTNSKNEINDRIKEKRREDLEGETMDIEKYPGESGTISNNIEEEVSESNIISSKEEMNNGLNEKGKDEIEGESVDINKASNITSNKDEIKEKVKERKNEKIDSVNFKDIENEVKPGKEKRVNEKEGPKVISLNQARVKMGKEEVDTNQLKDNLRKDLQKEYRDGKKLKSESIQKVKQEKRADALKKKLGISKSQIQSKERALKHELNKINGVKEGKGKVEAKIRK